MRSAFSTPGAFALVCILFLASFPPAGFAAATAAGAKPAEGARPNILFIIADGHGVQALGAYGSTLISTPAIDRIGIEGVRFDQSFVANAAAGPSQATALTGVHSHVHGVRRNGDAFAPQEPTLPSLLGDAGYETAFIGQWALGDKSAGFAHRELLLSASAGENIRLAGPGGGAAYKGSVPAVLTERALDWLDQRSDARPWLLVLSHASPVADGWPGSAWDKAGSAPATSDVPEPESLFDDYALRPAAAAAPLRIAPDHLKGASIGNTPEAQAGVRSRYQAGMQDYLAAVRALDASVGDVLAALEARGALDNTLVIYTSNHGVFLGEHGWFGSGFIYEQSLRTPLLMRWPAHIPGGGERAQALVQNIDLMPTLLAVAGVSAPAGVQGQSLLPLFAGDDPDFRTAIYYHHYGQANGAGVAPHYGSRNYRFKLVRFYDAHAQWEFYDLRHDPLEVQNVYDDPLWGILGDVAHKQLNGLQEKYADPVARDGKKTGPGAAD